MSIDRLLAAAIAKGVLIVTAESCTGGMIAGAITDIAGASAIFDRGFVTYSNNSKQEMLGVREDTLAKYGAVSEQVAQEMAEGALARSDANLALSVTGIAGPGGSDHKPEGRVCFGLVQDGCDAFTETVEFGAIGRAQVRTATVVVAMEMLLGAVDT
ncbi:MAG: CinA family protein [Rhodobacteraceae bacterium]|nr:CinA family protein [Paracoccaceae bacterium]